MSDADWNYLLRWTPALLAGAVLMLWGLLLRTLDRRDRNREDRARLEQTKPAA